MAKRIPKKSSKKFLVNDFIGSYLNLSFLNGVDGIILCKKTTKRHFPCLRQMNNKKREIKVKITIEVL